MLESIGNLRNIAYGYAPNIRRQVNMACDEIEQEIAERYIDLPEGWTAEQAGEVLRYWPKWDDGSPCMFGDEFTCWPTYYHKEEYDALSRLVIYAPDHVWDKGKDTEEPHSGGYYEWNFTRPGGKNAEEWRPTKRKPRTLEEVLRDFAKEVNVKSSDFISVDGENAYLLAAINETADEIRGMMA